MIVQVKKKREKRNIKVGRVFEPLFTAPKKFVKMQLGYQGYVAASTAGAGYFGIAANSIYQPLSVLGLLPTTDGKLTPTSSSSVTANMIGYTSLTTQYVLYRVFNARLKVTAMPVVNGDDITLMGMPYVDLTTASVPLVFQTLIGNSGSKWKLCCPGAGNTFNSITLRADIANVLGLTGREWSAQIPTLYTTYPPSANLVGFLVQWSTIDGANNSSQIFFDISLEMDVEFSGRQIVVS